MIARLARADLADLLVPPPGVDAKALRTEAASIRQNLNSMAADAVEAGYSRSMLAAAAERARVRLDQISAQLAEAAGASALQPFMVGDLASQVWDDLDLARRRAVSGRLPSSRCCPLGAGLGCSSQRMSWSGGILPTLTPDADLLNLGVKVRSFFA